jgi:hypothetical protein
MDYRSEFYAARWHLDVAKRMLGTYDEYPEKRILVGVIREGAKTAGKLVRAFLIREGIKGNLDTFTLNVGPKYLDAIIVENLVKILQIEKEQRLAKVEFIKGNKVLLFVDGKWKVLRVSRLKEIVYSFDKAICQFPAGIKR